MNIDKVRAHIRRWVDETLSVPSPLFNNLPPCPYAREALLNNRVDIRCVDGAELLGAVAKLQQTWDDKHELILLASDPATITPEALIAGIEGANPLFEASDLVCFFDHPRCEDPKYIVTSANGEYVLVGVQRLGNFLKAAKPLYKKKYFEQARKQYLDPDKLGKLG